MKLYFKRLELLTSERHSNTKKELIGIILEDDAPNTEEILTVLMKDTIKLHSSIKSNSLNESEPNIIISEELTKKFFKK